MPISRSLRQLREQSAAGASLTNPDAPVSSFTPVEVQPTNSSIPEGAEDVVGAGIEGFKKKRKKDPNSGLSDQIGAGAKAAADELKRKLKVF